MTDDAYADLQPAWSPDGRTLAWVTDRFSTKLGNL
ncbi:MAG: PD40 domain-containing protein, partial [Gemmatimonadetes bacterium]|nr:PD40 domain-containing protein [Gemmatimonadota bacterium]